MSHLKHMSVAEYVAIKGCGPRYILGGSGLRALAFFPSLASLPRGQWHIMHLCNPVAALKRVNSGIINSETVIRAVGSEHVRII